MRLRDLLGRLDARDAGGDLDRPLQDVQRDSRRVGPGSAFVAIEGARVDGHTLIDALGVCAGVVISRSVPLPPGLGWVRVDSTRRALAEIAAALCGDPARLVPVVGVTGTNGKTSVTTLLASALGAMGHVAGRIGTTGMALGAQTFRSELTTPEAPELQRALRRMVDGGARCVAMEVSSIGVVQERVAALPLHVGVFTNLGRDHLDFHGTIEAYARAKARVFSELLRPAGGMPRALLYGDEPTWSLMSPPEDHWRFGFAAGNHVRIHHAELRADGMSLRVSSPVGEAQLDAPLVGRHNALNLVASWAAGVLAGFSPVALAAAFREARGAVGRLEPVRVEGGPLVLVDYAHTPDALKAAIAAARSVCRGQVWLVFGCGGDRDPGKRPMMGAASAAADQVWVTSDNPRSEDPAAIVAAVVTGMSEGRFQVELDRARAIAAVIQAARVDDVVLIAGKGHETWQEVSGRRIPFDDRVVARAALEARCT